MQGGLEIPIQVTVKMECNSQNKNALATGADPEISKGGNKYMEGVEVACLPPNVKSCVGHERKTFISHDLDFSLA